MMIETHPFENFVPPGAKYLILGSFTGKEAQKGFDYSDPSYDWFYGTKRNQFWQLLEAVYECELKDLQRKQELFTRLGIAIADIIYRTGRKHENNLDSNLEIKWFNEKIRDILAENPIERIFFTSRFVERKFRQHFIDLLIKYPTVELVTLPSPSPRYARMRKEQKVEKCRELLPQFQELSTDES